MSDPKATFCVSDLHLHDRYSDGYLFTRDKERVFCRLIDRVIEEDGELILAGDVIDLTGQVWPRSGLEDFFDVAYKGGRAAAAASGVDLPAEREPSVEARVAATKNAYPDVFAGLGRLAARNRLKWIPGNHDWEMFTDRGRAALRKAIGAAASTPMWVDERYVWAAGSFVVTSHGHQYDQSNRIHHELTVQDGWRNEGAAITAVLYNAVMPALRSHGVDPRLVAQIPAVRPEENIIEGLATLPLFAANPDLLTKFLRAFVGLLDDNGYNVPFGKLAALVVTPDLVKKELRNDSGMGAVLRDKAREIVSGAAGWLGLDRQPPRAVIMGHSHDIDGAPGYVNLGTWIDHLTTLGGARDLRLPVARVDKDGAVLYDARDYLGQLASATHLWSMAAV